MDDDKDNNEPTDKPTYKIVRRPGNGTVGDKIKVRSNFFEILTLPEDDIIQYDVSITPEVPPKLNRRVFERFVEMYRAGPLGGAKPVYDGRKNMFAHKIMPFGHAETFDVELGEDNAPVASRRPPRQFNVKLRRVGKGIKMDDLIKFINVRGDLTKHCSMAIMALDVIISYRASTLYTAVGRSFYISDGYRPLREGAEAWQGYYQSVRPTFGRMMINIDLTATAFYERGPLIKLVAKILNKRSPDDLRRGLTDKEHQLIDRSIKRIRIKENHRAGKSRKFKIEGLTQTPASHTTFDKGDGSKSDIQTYFGQTYNLRLIHAHLPCIIVRRDTYLPMEVCDVIEGQRCIRKLTKDQIDDIREFTCVDPNKRSNNIREGINRLDYQGDEHLKQFGMRISKEMAAVDARILKTPTIHYHPSSREHSITPKFGAWNLRDKRVATGATLGSWSVVAFLSENDLPDQIIRAFVKELINTCQNTGMNIPNKNPPIMHANPQGNVEEALKQAWIRAGNVAKAQPQLILCILPTTDEDLYAEIKRVNETVIGIASQCVQRRHMLKPKIQYCANVCLKMNVKLGGLNSYLSPNQIPFISDLPTIVMGADVTHPSPGDSESPSEASICASMDAKASRYAATTRIQGGREEIIADLGNMVKDLLKIFYQTCGQKPKRILFYRDGVSEGQFGQVQEFEIKAIKAACRALDAEYKPSITFVIVQKKHHTRFFPIDRRNADRSGNCLPGTTVDTGVTRPYEFDFYLLSHAGLQGTSRPAHYHVLYDDNDFTSDELQTLSYNLCYIYARCTRSVSLVPPVYYAHLVCARTRLYLKNSSNAEVKPVLQKVMYFM